MIGMGKQITCPYCRRPGELIECYYGICDVKHEDTTCKVYDVHLNPEDLAGVPMVDYWEDYEEEDSEDIEGEVLGEELGLEEDFWEELREELEGEN